ncbi:MAG: thiamine phosphate synthase [Clostridia bacterium]
MKLSKKSLQLYLVTDRSWLSGVPLINQVETCIENGVTMVQLREKNLSREHFLSEAIALSAMCKKHGVPFLINDDVEIAILSDADGVHVGQSDMAAGNVRARIGDNKILGVSAHSVSDAIAAEAAGADYLGVGAVFGTSTKLDAGNVALDTLRDICSAISIPVVAIGGISASNTLKLQDSGVVGVAVISAILAQPDVSLATRQMLALTNELVNE